MAARAEIGRSRRTDCVGSVGYGNATALVAEGVHLKTAQTRLGHSDPRLTLAIYAQATSEGDRAAADRVAERLLPAVARHDEPKSVENPCAMARD